MSVQYVAIGLKIPDNEAYTALSALRRLGVDVARIERNGIWCVTSDESPAEVAVRVQRNEAIFNPNKHRLTLLDAPMPRPGEVWIEAIDGHEPAARRYVAWRLFDISDAPAARATLQAAVERLLCNPAIERAHFPDHRIENDR